MNRKENFTAGFTRENPVFSLYPGPCSILIITIALSDATGMGAVVIVVLIIFNAIISLIRNITPSEIRIPVYIVITATLAKIIQMLIKAYVSSLDSVLGVFILLVIINCTVLGRTEVFASKNGIFDSAPGGLGMGLGYTVSVVLISAIRQIIATGTLSFDNPLDTAQNIFSIRTIPEDFAVSMFSQPFSVFCILAYLAVELTAYKSHQQNKAKRPGKEVK